MTGDDEKPPQYVRAHRAKHRGISASNVDGGAIAIAVLVVLSAFASTVVLPIPEWESLALVGMGLITGGFLLRRLIDAGTGMALVHGVLGTVVFLGIAAVVHLAEQLAERDDSEIGAIGTILSDPLPTIGVILVAFLLTSIGVVLGRNE